MFKANNKPSLTDLNIVRIWKSVVEKINAQNYAIVFTHCDLDGEFDVEYAEEWFNEGMGT